MCPIMLKNIYSKIFEVVEGCAALSVDDARAILDLDQLDTFELLAVAYKFRKQHFGKSVTLHILNNVQNGLCPEDCRYCAQSASSSAPIEEYPMKSDDEILAEAAQAYAAGAGRYCMVFSGTGPSDERIEHLTRLIREIKRRHTIEVCVSPGVINAVQARQLKDAGLDRLNHNLNTSEQYYRYICTSHTHADRLRTLEAAHSVGLAVCSGVIVGMGEAFGIMRGLREVGYGYFGTTDKSAVEEDKSYTPEHNLRWWFHTLQREYLVEEGFFNYTCSAKKCSELLDKYRSLVSD